MHHRHRAYFLQIAIQEHRRDHRHNKMSSHEEGLHIMERHLNIRCHPAQIFVRHENGEYAGKEIYQEGKNRNCPEPPHVFPY